MRLGNSLRVTANSHRRITCDGDSCYGDSCKGPDRRIVHETCDSFKHRLDPAKALVQELLNALVHHLLNSLVQELQKFQTELGDQTEVGQSHKGANSRDDDSVINHLGPSKSNIVEHGDWVDKKTKTMRSCTSTTKGRCPSRAMLPRRA